MVWAFVSANLLSKIVLVSSFILCRIGQEYGIRRLQKFILVCRMFRNSHLDGCVSSFMEHFVLAKELLGIPCHIRGDVAEFGCYKGLSTASLSLMCDLVGRRLHVFDSFSGLPEPSIQITNMISGQKRDYRRGEYLGTLEEVKDNVSRYGVVEVCEFIEGYFNETLRRQPEIRYVMVFEDADLPESVEAVVIYVWPNLAGGCKFFSHEARDLEVVKVFYDDVFFEARLGMRAPGLVGAGAGLPLNYDVKNKLTHASSCLGYAEKTELS